MNVEKALTQVVASFREGAELRSRVANDCGRRIVEAAAVITNRLQSGGKLLFFGNGGSAADAQHLAAEFVGRFVLTWRALVSDGSHLGVPHHHRACTLRLGGDGSFWKQAA
jgi:phosphoheptose isomerase